MRAVLLAVLRTVFLFLEIVGWKLENADVDQIRHNQRVCQAECDIKHKLLLCHFPLKHRIRCAVVHHQKPDNVGKPISDDHGHFEQTFKKNADNDGKQIRERDVDERVVPPRER